MRNLLSLLLLLALAPGCASEDSRLLGADMRSAAPPEAPQDSGYDNNYGDDDADEADDNGEPTGAPGVAVAWIEPTGEGHHYRRPLRIGFTGNALGATLRIAGADGSALPTEVEWSADGRELTIWARDGLGAPPSQRAWLRPDARYTAELDLGQTYGVFEFMTSSVGTEAPDGLDVTAQAYVFDVGSASSPSLPGLVSMLDAATDGAGWLWQFRDSSAGAGLDLEAGLGTDADPAAEQQECAPTAALGVTDKPVSFEASPFFETTPGVFQLETGIGALQFEEGWLDGDVSPDGTELVEVGFRGWLRAQEVAELFALDLCEAAPTQLGGECAACPSGQGDCLWVELEGLGASASGSELLSIPDPSEVDCDGVSPSYVACSAAAGTGSGLLLFLPVFGMRRRR